MSIKDGKIFGIGINDANYKLSNWEIIEGVYCPSGRKKYKCTWRCPYYSKWRSMLQRCYDSNYHKTRPTYKEVAVCEDWHLFSKFRQWMVKQDWRGKHLDKDIVCPNKVYSPETCVFITKEVNMLLLDSGATRGKYQQGVAYRKDCRKFQANCRSVGKSKNLGLFPTEALAYEAYVNYKHNLILEVAAEQEDHRVRDGLLLHAQILLDTLEDNE